MKTKGPYFAEADHREHYQRNAPATDQGYYLVPKVIE